MNLHRWLPGVFASVLVAGCDVAPVENRIDATVLDGAIIDGGIDRARADRAIVADGPPCLFDPPASWCVLNCVTNFAQVERFICLDGATWVCPPGFVDKESCPAAGCGVAPMACCDGITGAVTSNSMCDSDGLRPPCPAGTRAANSSMCIPDSLEITDCRVLTDQPCTDVGMSCHSATGLETRCLCSDAGASLPTWRCSVSIGG